MTRCSNFILAVQALHQHAAFFFSGGGGGGTVFIFQPQKILGGVVEPQNPPGVLPSWASRHNISLGIGAESANFVRFRGSLPLLPHLCPLSVPYGGGMWGIFGKPLTRAIRNTPGLHAVLTICLRFLSVFGRCLCGSLPRFVCGGVCGQGQSCCGHYIPCVDPRRKSQVAGFWKHTRPCEPAAPSWGCMGEIRIQRGHSMAQGPVDQTAKRGPHH